MKKATFKKLTTDISKQKPSEILTSLLELDHNLNEQYLTNIYLVVVCHIVMMAYKYPENSLLNTRA